MTIHNANNDDNICERLDSQLVSIIQLLESYQRGQGQLSSSLRQGYMGLAQARYSKGRDAVSLWRIPPTFEAKLGVDVYAGSGNEFDESNYNSQDVSSLQIQARPLLSSNSNGKNAVSSVTSSSYHSPLEQRKRIPSNNSIAFNNVALDSQPLIPIDLPSSDHQSYNNNNINNNNNNNYEMSNLDLNPLQSQSPSAANNSGQKDPSLWFGILMTGLLKDPQADFKRVVMEACELAVFKLKLNSALDRFKALQEEKRRLLDSLGGGDFRSSGQRRAELGKSSSPFVQAAQSDHDNIGPLISF